ncbi:Zinc finger, C2H2-like protein [Corchorus capsularis]|uniref:Zinc finger, C2H2-like protein n=1 Tax=Corchorus capsularis TaxID=210143 RepID=A0A1R3IMW6_COCAP|nr:Zinc finger, C2H2-like protein [Corchorus capsularis]
MAMEIDRDEDEFSRKTSGETENGNQGTVDGDDDFDHGSSSSSTSSSSYFLDGKSSNTKSSASSSCFLDGKTKKKSPCSSSPSFVDGKTKTQTLKLLDLGQKNTNVLEDQEGEFGRSCPYCGQGFKSGKALGGHIRIHKVKVAKQIADQKDNNHVCDICNVNFPSKQSLCGHMKSHPGRTSKGIQPPKQTTLPKPEPEPEPESESEPELEPEFEFPVQNLVDFISNWTVTGRRGRKATISAEKLRMIEQVVEKKRKIEVEDEEDGNQLHQAKFQRVELMEKEISEEEAVMQVIKPEPELEEGEILDDQDLPEEGEIIEDHELDNDNGSNNNTIISHEDLLITNSYSTLQALDGSERDELGLFDNKKMKKREEAAYKPAGSMVRTSKKTAGQHYGNTVSNHKKSCLGMSDDDEEIDFQVEPAGKNGSFNHKASLSLKANQAAAGTMKKKMLDLDLNLLPYEE